jgi:Putative transposase/Transposase zinc-binding domain
VPRPAGRPPLEVADILRAHAERYSRDHCVSARQQTVLRHLVDCRTATLGGHVDRCTSCERIRISYNSCRDRHCPKCQSLKKAEWLEARREHLLPIPYWHVVFTLPDALHALALHNKRVFYDLLFDSAADALRTAARDPRLLGAEIGFTAILHTWGQTLQFHPHLHCVVTGGGLDRTAQRWVPARAGFLLPVRVLGRLFRGKFLAALRDAHGEGRLHESAATQPGAWKRLLDHLYGLDWVVYAKPPFGGPDHVFRYLGRYTHRVAIANHRLLAFVDGRITFKVRDYADRGKKKRLTLTAGEFIRRFLLHVLPRGFVRIRHYGLLAPRTVSTLLAQARVLLDAARSADNSATPRPHSHASPRWWERLLRLTGIDVMLCPYCGTGRLVRSAVSLPARAPP